MIGLTFLSVLSIIKYCICGNSSGFANDNVISFDSFTFLVLFLSINLLTFNALSDKIFLF